VKCLYLDDTDFNQVYKACEKLHLINFIGLMVIYLKKKRLGVPDCFLREFVICEAHENDLIGYFRWLKLYMFCMNIFIDLKCKGI
jgi:hypothetical protein